MEPYHAARTVLFVFDVFQVLGDPLPALSEKQILADAQGNVTLFRGLVRLPKPCSGNLSILLQVGPLVTEDRRPSRSCSKQSELRCYGTYWMILRASVAVTPAFDIELSSYSYQNSATESLY